jgi:hypothetical protein
MSIRYWATLATALVLGGCGEDAVADANAAVAAEGEAVVAELPLARGFYVTSDTPCAGASNATLLLLRRDGIGGSRDFCAFSRIVRTAADRYRVTEECRSGGEAWGGEESVEKLTVDYAIDGPRGFRITYPGAQPTAYRHCPQTELPEPWRDNDISDLTG